MLYNTGEPEVDPNYANKYAHRAGTRTPSSPNYTSPALQGLPSSESSNNLLKGREFIK